MKNCFKKLLLICVLGCQLITLVHAEPYHLIAGSSMLGFRENAKQNVSLGFNAAFNSLLTSANVKCDFKNYDTSKELSEAISKQEVNGFFGTPLEFIESESFFKSSPLASGIFGQKIKAKTLLLVRKDSGIVELEQLKGKKISIQKSLMSDVGGLYIETLFLEHQLLPIKNFFSEIKYSETSNSAFVDLFFKKVDATLISETQFDIAVELNPQMREQTQIIEASEPYLIFVTALAKNTPEQEADNIKKSLFTVHKTPKGRNILNLMKMQGFIEISISDLDNIRALIEKNKRLKAQKNVR
jgi:hypothetical protein